MRCSSWDCCLNGESSLDILLDGSAGFKVLPHHLEDELVPGRVAENVIIKDASDLSLGRIHFAATLCQEAGQHNSVLLERENINFQKNTRSDVKIQNIVSIESIKSIENIESIGSVVGSISSITILKV